MRKIEEEAFLMVEGTTKGEVGSRVGRAGVMEGTINAPVPSSTSGLLCVNERMDLEIELELGVLVGFRSGVVCDPSWNWDWD